MNDKEKEFFETFNIDAKYHIVSIELSNSSYNILGYATEDSSPIYPKITSEILLQLINIIIHKNLEFGCSYSKLHNTYFASKEDKNGNYLSCQEYNLKDAILSLCINLKYDIMDEVRELFE